MLGNEIALNNLTSDADFRTELNLFLESVASAAVGGASDDIPHVEAPRKIIEYINRGRAIEGFDSVGWCVFNGVKVFEAGKREEILANEARIERERLQGKI